MGQPALGDRHSNTIAAALAEGAGGDLHTGCDTVFRMPRAAAPKLAKLFDVVDCHSWLVEGLPTPAYRLHAGEMQNRIKQHRGVSVGQHEPITVGPVGVARIISQEALP